MVRVSVGQSWHESAYQAGREATRRAIINCAQAQGGTLRRAALALVFAGTHYTQEQVLAGIGQVLGPSIPVLGCSTAAQLMATGVTVDSVAVMIIWAGSHLAAFPVVAHGVDANPAVAGLQLGLSVLRQLPPGVATFTGAVRAGDRTIVVRPYTLLLFADTRSGDMSPLVAAASDVLGPAFQIVGGLTGDRLNGAPNHQLVNQTVYRDAVVGIVLINRAPTAIGIGHGCSPCSASMMVTRAEGTILYELNGQPAIDMYHNRFGAVDAPPFPAHGATPNGRLDATRQPWTDQTERQPINGLATRVLAPPQHPVGILESTGAYRMRCPLHVHSDGAIQFAATIPEGLAVRWMACTAAGAVQAARQAAQTALVGLGRARPAAALMFSPALQQRSGETITLRRSVLHQAVLAVREVIGPEVPLIGFPTSGEIASTATSAVELHNLMNVIYLIGA